VGWIEETDSVYARADAAAGEPWPPEAEEEYPPIRPL
jgi:hypothetical protein